MRIVLMRQRVLVEHVNLRQEKHGDESVLATDVKCQMQVANGLLSMFDPGLKAALYGPPVDPQTVDAGPDYLPTLRFRSLSKLVFDGEMKGAQVTFHGVKKKDDLVMTADINSFRIEPLDGGTVTISFRAQVCPLPDEAWRLAGLLGVETEISVAEAGVVGSPLE